MDVTNVPDVTDVMNVKNVMNVINVLNEFHARGCGSFPFSFWFSLSFSFIKRRYLYS